MKWIFINACIIFGNVGMGFHYIVTHEYVDFPRFRHIEASIYSLIVFVLLFIVLAIQHWLSHPDKKWIRAGWRSPFSLRAGLLQPLFLFGWSSVLLGAATSTAIWYFYSDYQALNSLIIMFTGCITSAVADLSNRIFKSRLA
ncbi:hypothetical protein L3V77_09770 [Vibrio sp. DW001]|uniref:hypothetical protein n=1 Tax=Vibrio sp. DW001 TaxID=2912315 RepID=UPI0023B04BF1|nr:hypothetical protein [Vibrio sp. DW001]WED25360.1 hypothetical protein L3V77_09770 [Vibrio sp. DW001]